VTAILALLIGVLYAGGIYLTAGRNIARIVLGIVLLSHATNMLIFVAGGLTRGEPPIVPLHVESVDPERFANPLSQALILTAIVIGLGMQALVLALVYRTMRATATADTHDLTTTEEPDRGG
jgi:multicomponent Na+:H+ antiporter subunit C